uniref:Uncharacterized protein n=1 Tax=Anguilla anguilla TaxID=7936 RepID=A0A0E9VU24_ANGAN
MIYGRQQHNNNCNNKYKGPNNHKISNKDNSHVLWL